MDVSVSGAPVKADLTAVKTPQTYVNLPNSPALPLPFAVGDYPEVTEPVSAPLQLPVTVNGRLSKAAEVDKYELAVTPGEEFDLRAASSRTGHIEDHRPDHRLRREGQKARFSGRWSATGGCRRSAGQQPDAGRSESAFQSPGGCSSDFPDGGRHRATRRHALRLSLDRIPRSVRTRGHASTTPFVNIPAGGTALVNVNVERHGYMGPIQIEAANVPKGRAVAGGDIPAEIPDPNNRATSRRSMLTLDCRRWQQVFH